MGYYTGTVVLVVIELVLFYAITNVKFKKRDLIFALVIWLGNQLTAQLAPGVSDIVGATGTIALYYCYFYKRIGKLLTVAAITLICSVLILTYLMSDYVFAYLPVFLPIDQLILPCQQSIS